MELQVLGAAGEVTGSCYLLRLRRRQVLVDCGLVQGGPADETRNRDPFPFDPATLDAVVLTHAHLDHSGRLPLLVRAGFRGPVYTHRASRDLCRVMLKDAAFLAERDAEVTNRRRQRKRLPPLEPLYTMRDAQRCVRRFRPLEYGERHRLFPGVEVRLVDAGHILGSACVEIWLKDEGDERKLVFSGDLGHRDAPILRDPTSIRHADLVLMESTYGDRLHRGWAATWEELGEVLKTAQRQRGNVLIPAFAVGRTQELLYAFALNYDAWELDRWTVFLDSPMAIEATEVYARHGEVYDAEAAARTRTAGSPFQLPGLQLSRTPHQSMAINRVRSGAIIIAGSGMCTGGRIRHHLKHNVWRRDCHVLMVGFQARGTPGRRLVDGAKWLKLWGEPVRVAAQVHTVGGFSAHADAAGLADWYGGFADRPPLLLTHGEPASIATLQRSLQDRFGAPVHAPRPGERLALGRLPRPPWED